jgi:hypothetical protein
LEIVFRISELPALCALFHTFRHADAAVKTAFKKLNEDCEAGASEPKGAERRIRP